MNLDHPPSLLAEHVLRYPGGGRQVGNPGGLPSDWSRWHFCLNLETGMEHLKVGELPPIPRGHVLRVAN